MRRKPSQERSKETVDAILEATARIIGRDGLARLSTNRIAKVAGVSVGSIYQYFPNKEAILAAVADQQVARFEASLRQLLQASEGIPLEELIPGVIRAMFAMRREHALLQELTRLGSTLPGEVDRRIDLAERLRTVLRRLLQRQTSGLRPMDPDLVSFVLVHALQGNISALDRGVEPWFLEPDELIDELTLLVLRYLQPE